MDSKSIRNHRSVSEEESQSRFRFSLVQSFPEGKRKSYHVRKKERVGGGLDECLLSQDVVSYRPSNDKEPFRQFILLIPSSYIWGFHKYRYRGWNTGKSGFDSRQARTILSFPQSWDPFWDPSGLQPSVHQGLSKVIRVRIHEATALIPHLNDAVPKWAQEQCCLFAAYFPSFEKRELMTSRCCPCVCVLICGSRNSGAKRDSRC